MLEKIGKVAYKLQLPPNMRIHPTFHVSRLKKYVSPTTYDERHPAPLRPPPDIIEQRPEWEVEAIRDKRQRRHRRQNRVEYLVKWKDYPEEDNTWEPIANLQNAMEIVREYEEELENM